MRKLLLCAILVFTGCAPAIKAGARADVIGTAVVVERTTTTAVPGGTTVEKQSQKSAAAVDLELKLAYIRAIRDAEVAKAQTRAYAFPPSAGSPDGWVGAYRPPANRPTPWWR